uniref:Uncharacterized protein n=1 Tax=Peronospora matthiolae TaxID=2874970 RepID=A0AAV1TN71_9STRA
MEQPWSTRLSKKGRSKPKAFRTVPSKPISIARDYNAMDVDEKQQQEAEEPTSMRKSTSISKPLNDHTVAIEAVEKLEKLSPHGTITSEESQRKTVCLERGPARIYRYRSL